ncbi:MAG: sn-glycerol-1-phosphate dehydrogenase [Bacillota bacterium]
MKKITEYLGKEFECQCGSTHQVSIKDIRIGKGILDQVPVLLENLTGYKKIYIICDTNTYQAAGRELEKSLKVNGFLPEIVMLESPEDEKIHPDTDYLFELLEGVDRDGYFVACGSGTINDLTRYASFKMGRPYTVVATAPSMDGYASPVSPITVKGVKRTFAAEPPEAIVADISILQDAPREMIRSGLGDLLGKISSQLDWRLSHILFGEEYCPFIGEMLIDELNILLDLNLELNSGQDKEKAIKVLTEGLIKSGLAMLMAETSRPASGTEHQVAHFLEMYGVMYKQEITGHGINVGFGEYFASHYYLKLKDMDFSQFQVKDSRKQREREIKENYKERAEFALGNLEISLSERRLEEKILQEKEEEIKELIEEYRPLLESVEEKLLQTGILSKEYLDQIPEGWLMKALKHGLEIRTRFTVADLLKQVGCLEQWVDEIGNDFWRKINK